MKFCAHKNRKKLNSPTSLIDEGKTITNPKNIALRKTLITSSQKLARLCKTRSHLLENIIQTTS